MKAILSRTYNSSETLGTLMIMEGERPLFKCKTIELPFNGNQRNTSCIPEGTYIVEKYTSPSKGEVFHVKDVPDRDSILIHKGNYTTDTLGCILPGSYFTDLNDDGKIDVAESTKTMKYLLDLLPDIFKLIIL
jgi:hypothetical protein